MVDLIGIVQKIAAGSAMASRMAAWRSNGEKVVFTNGCFDLIHRGHIDYLYRASQLGDRLVVGLNSDRSVRTLKGATRPYQDELSRAMLLASMFYVDAVVLFDEETPYSLIGALVPDILVKGSDYRAEDIVGYDIVTAAGGRVVTMDYLEGFSTTAIAQRIRGEVR
jgi:D-glycero-beta-D-manno-heptose 1-phosphate adenylyltransferase